MNIDYFIKTWKKDLSKLDESEQFWNLRADEFNNHGSNQDEKRRQQVVDFLKTRNMLLETGEVLDIGCGPGKYTLEFAKCSKQVTGIDISPKMLEYAYEKAQQQKVENVYFELSPWETVSLDECGWQKKYDLVFASMCPGISSSDSLLKMCRASKGGCFFSSFVERKDHLRDKLYQLVFGQDPKQHWGKGIYYAVNLLWLSGYYPEITYHDNAFDHSWTLEKAIELYSRQLKQMANLSEAPANMDQKIAEYLRSIAVDGIVSEKVQSKIAWLYWKV